ncbi:MAG: hypothetical protein IJC88_05735 [Oscillospiraceae bacterium]|nr:hypothetical protein [Oscillospiraceae bacterium]
MDVNGKTEVINSVASSEIIPCPRCGTSNIPENQFCISCGSALPASTAPKEDAPESEAPAFAPLEESETPEPEKEYVEPNNIFAQGLPDWSIEPPQVLVRRR